MGNNKLIAKQTFLYLTVLLSAGIEASARDMSLSTYQSEMNEIRTRCESSRGTFEPSGSSVNVYEDSAARNGDRNNYVRQPLYTCRSPERSYSNASVTRQRDPNSDCNNASAFSAQNGNRCRQAEQTIQGVQGRARAMQELNMLGAGALQVNNAANIPRTQKQAVSQQAFNMKTAIATGLLDTVNHGYGAMEQGRAEELARSSARGISNGQTTYDEARMAASRVAGRHGSEFRAALSRHSTKEDIVQEATERAALAERNRARSVGFGNGPEALRARLADDPNHTAARESQEARNNSIRQAADRFDQSLQADGLSETARQFDSFEQMRGASQRGVTESREVAERAAQGAGQSRMQALGSALQTAQSIAAYRQLMRTQNDLGTLPQTPRRLIGLDTPGAAPTTPAIPGGSAVAAIDPGIDAGDDTSPAMARERMGSGIKTGGGFATGQYKPRQAQASSGGGGGGGFGGGGGPPNRAPASRQNLGPSSFDYGGSAGGGGRMNEFGGAAANAGGSDLQDAIKSLLGEGEKDPNQKLEEFRELASVQDGQNQEASVDNSRSLFERVNEKYNSLQNNGII